MNKRSDTITTIEVVLSFVLCVASPIVAAVCGFDGAGYVAVASCYFLILAIFTIVYNKFA